MVQSAAEALVVGGGPAGLTAAIALAQGGVATALVAPRVIVTDNRASGLLPGSVGILHRLGVWTDCEPHASAISRMRIIETSPAFVRAREVDFAAAEVAMPVFGANIENRFLLAALEQRAARLPALTRIEDLAEAVTADAAGVTVRLRGGGSVRARVAVGADGQASACRAAAGIAMTGWTYAHTAIALCFGHGRPHGGVSFEFHGRDGPLTIVPLPGARSSLVLVVDRDTAARLEALDDGALSEEIERRSLSMLGRITVERGHGTFPIAMKAARRFAAHRIALVGEAAHVIPPFGGQGLNLGLRDSMTIAELVIEAKRTGRDPGADEILAEYEIQRRPDFDALRRGLGFAARLLLSDAAAMHGLRCLTHLALHRIGPLRRAVMRQGLQHDPEKREPVFVKDHAQTKS